MRSETGLNPLVAEAITDSTSILVSRAGDAANLLVVVPVLLTSMVLARRRHLLALLLWSGALFYLVYIYSIYLLGAPLSVLVIAYVALVAGSAVTLTGLVMSVDHREVARRFGASPVRPVGGSLVIIGLLAYAGLASTGITMLGGGEELRAQWVIDSALGTPVLLAGGVLLWRRTRLGYVIAPAVLLVSAIGGLAFAAAALLAGPLNDDRTDLWVVAVHLVISTLSLALLGWLTGGFARYSLSPSHDRGGALLLRGQR